MRRNLFFGIYSIIFSTAVLGQTGFDIKKKHDISTKSFTNRVVNGKNSVRTPDDSRSQLRKTEVSRSSEAAVSQISYNKYNVYRLNDGTANFISTKETSSSGSQRIGQGNAESMAMSFLEEIKPLLNLSPNSEFEIEKISGGRAIFHQTYKGIEVYGTQVAVNTDLAGNGESFSGKYSSCNYDFNPKYKISSSKALSIAISEAKKNHGFISSNENAKKLLGFHEPKVKRVIYEIDSDKAVAAYEVSFMAHLLAPLTYFINAITGDVITSYLTLCAINEPVFAQVKDLNGVIRSINTLSKERIYFLADITKPMYNDSTGEGTIYTYDARNTQGEDATLFSSENNDWQDAASVSAHYNAEVVYDYFLRNHNWNSINGQGGDIISLVNVADEHGNPLQGSFWNGQAIFYGNGGDTLRSLAASLDLAGHEMTHGVIQNTANLEYRGESGAINESIADIFGFMMDQDDWKIGEDVVNEEIFKTGALRNLEDPNQGGNSLGDFGFQPAHVEDQYNGNDDNGGVHINSGIPNHAFYLLASEIGNEKAANVFFLALTKYLTRFSKFVDLRLACEQGAKDLFGESSSQLKSTIQAFDSVGIKTGAPTKINRETPPVKGDEFLLSVDTDDTEESTIFRSTVKGAEFLSLSKQEVLRKPSVTGNGKTIYYIGGDSAIYSLDVSMPESPTEKLINNQLDWGNVVVSRDGKHLAAVTTAQDTSVYILDFEQSLWTKFVLYNPTFTDSLRSPGPVYADALDWDLSGEYVVYDAYNQLGDSLAYWDVNLIKVWNNKSNDFGSGDIEKLLVGLPNNVSIGNPSFSKNSPYVLVFDTERKGVNGKEHSIYAYDIEKNLGKTIYANNTLGWPNFNNHDDRIGFTTIGKNSRDQDISIIKAIGVDSTRLNASTEAAGIINNAKWPIFYVVTDGRIPGVLSSDKISVDFEIYPNPVENELSVNYTDQVYATTIVDLQGHSVLQIDGDHKNINVANLNAGTYLLLITTDRNILKRRFIKR